jgi:hypothetical protein
VGPVVQFGGGGGGALRLNTPRAWGSVPSLLGSAGLGRWPVRVSDSPVGSK